MRSPEKHDPRPFICPDQSSRARQTLGDVTRGSLPWLATSSSRPRVPSMVRSPGVVPCKRVVRTHAESVLVEEGNLSCLALVDEQLANSLRIACEHRGQDRIVVPRLPESVPATWIDRLNGSPRQALNFLEPAVMNCVIAADTHVVVIRFTGAETGAEEQDDRSKPRRCLRFAQPAAKTDRRLRRQEPRYAPRSHW